MDVAPVRTSDTSNPLFGWRLRLRTWRRGLADLFAGLRKHPLALLGGVVLILYVVLALIAPYITTVDPSKGSLRARLTPPVWEEGGSWKYPLGTDAQGRDLLTRILFGSRVSLAIGFLSVGISALIGTVLGGLSGYFRGWLDNIVSRFADLLLAFPYLIFAIGMMAFLGPGFVNLILALTFKSWVEFFRLVRGAMLAEKTQEYVEAAKVGAGRLPQGRREFSEHFIRYSFWRPAHGIFSHHGGQLSFLGLGLPARCQLGSMAPPGGIFCWWLVGVDAPGVAISSWSWRLIYLERGCAQPGSAVEGRLMKIHCFKFET